MKRRNRRVLNIGLSIQIANQSSGLIPRLKTVESYVNKLSGIEEKIAFAKDKFAVYSSIVKIVTRHQIIYTDER